MNATIRSHGQILGRPSKPTSGTTHDVAYELGKCFQLDREHCLLVASLDEQGGGDKCVGNDAYVFSHLADIVPDAAIPLNRPDTQYRLASGGTAWLAKYPATGGFVPLDSDHPGRGTGFLVCVCMSFNEDGSSLDERSERVFEFIQFRWDGRELHVTDRAYKTALAGIEIRNVALSTYPFVDGALLAPFTTDLGNRVFRFEFVAGAWTCVSHGAPFITGHARGFPYPAPEVEPSLQVVDGVYWIHTRGVDPVGRLYRSEDGLNYRLYLEQAMHTVPQSLNQGLDGTLYLATSTFPTRPANWLRNPLVMKCLVDGKYGDPVTIHDEGGIRVDTGSCIPMVDHAVGCNVFLEGRKRHLLWYRVCDLKERTVYSSQADLAKLIGTPKPRMPSSGLYLAEIDFN